ncbi:putative ATPase family AAA domain-containing protein 1-B [Cocos nucifera]|uniref:Putative ATPase family AAA domain-containing protein 1-B n=1 Tax=Cocos nucifera TaxID=13894 RepID=A0A8K0N9R1_COCNU|nr:putative ATPase family AAA domain-containing protein 1-B [Cocos nucifera]
MPRGSYPPFSVAAKGQKVIVKFKIPPTCAISHLIVDLVTHLGLKAEQNGNGSEMLLRAWDSAAAWQITLNSPENVKDVDGEKHGGSFCILLFESLVGSEYCVIEFIKQGSFSFKELDAMVSALKLAGRKDVKKSLGKSPQGYEFKRDNKHGVSSVEKAVSALEAMGVRVYGFDDTCGTPMDGMISWNNIAGYDQQKRRDLEGGLEEGRSVRSVERWTRMQEIGEDNKRRDEKTENEDGPKPLAASDSLPSFGGTESLVNHERQRIEEMLRIRGMPRGSYPPFSVAAKGQKVIVKFKIPPTCAISHLIVDLVTHLGLKAEQNGNGSEMLLRAWDSAAAWQITLNSPENVKDVDGEKHGGSFCILLFESLVGSEYCVIEFIKQGSFSFKELDAMVSALKLAGRKDVKKSLGKSPQGYEFKRDNKHGVSSVEKAVSALEAMGVRVYGFDDTCGTPMDGMISWNNIAGYDQQKREIEDTILLALQSPEVYDDIARGTRTGKTSSARVIAKQAGVPLLYVPLEVIMSKYYGESERLLGNVFSLANELPNGAIIFLDEIDGFEQEKQVVVIAATNRKQDLDPALISRFDSMISFGLPDQQTREEISAQYAKHLKKSELVQFASATEEMSGRDIRDVCQQAERHWASKVIRGQAPKDVEGGINLPPIEEYIKCAEQRRGALSVITERSSRSPWKPLALA